MPSCLRGESPSRLAANLASVHRNQSGSISILSTFALLMFTMLLLLVTNVAQQVDDKVRMQTAVDAAAYSGGVVLARGMNAIAFANLLECDVFTMTAFLREARDRNAEKLVPEILAKWRETGGKFTPAAFEKFRPLPQAIANKTPLEQELVTAWGDMAHAAAEFALPVFEHILGTPETVLAPTNDHLIPNFQRAVLESIPGLAQGVTNEIALRHGLPGGGAQNVTQQMRDSPDQAANGRGPQFGVLWRTSVQAVGVADETDPMTRTLPVVDPDPAWNDFYALPNGQDYLDRALDRRRQFAYDDLYRWIHDDDITKGLGFFGDEAKMSRFQSLFWIACCAQLNQLLTVEYAGSNIPFLLRQDFGGALSDNEILERDYHFVATAYRAHVNEMAPLMYKNPIDQTADAVTFAQISLYLPRRMYACCPWATPWYEEDGTFSHWQAHTNLWPTAWSTFNQNWTVRLVPATADAIPSILQTNPGGYASGVRVPSLGGATMYEIDAVNTH